MHAAAVLNAESRPTPETIALDPPTRFVPFSARDRPGVHVVEPFFDPADHPPAPPACDPERGHRRRVFLVPGTPIHMPQWLVVVHRANDGPRVRHRIRALDLPGAALGASCEVHWPRFIERLPKRDDVIRPLYPGYMFVRPPEGAAWGAIVREVPNVFRVLADDRGKPIAVPDALVQRHIARAGGAMDGLIDETPESIARYRARQKLAVVSGPLAGWEGICTLDDGARVKLFLDMLGGPRPVTLPRDAVVPAPSK